MTAQITLGIIRNVYDFTRILKEKDAHQEKLKKEVAHYITLRKLHLATVFFWIFIVQDFSAAKDHAKSYKYDHDKRKIIPVIQRDHVSHRSKSTSVGPRDHGGHETHEGYRKDGHYGEFPQSEYVSHGYEPWRAWQKELLEIKKGKSHSWVMDHPKKQGYHYHINHEGQSSQYNHSKAKPKNYDHEHKKEDKYIDHEHSNLQTQQTDPFSKNNAYEQPGVGSAGHHPYYHSHKYLPNIPIKHEGKGDNHPYPVSSDYDDFIDYDDSEDDSHERYRYKHHEKDTKKEKNVNNFHHQNKEEHRNGIDRGGHSQSWFYTPIHDEHIQKKNEGKHYQVAAHVKVNGLHHELGNPKDLNVGSIHYKHHYSSKNDDLHEQKPHQGIHEDKHDHESYNKHKGISHYEHKGALPHEHENIPQHRHEIPPHLEPKGIIPILNHGKKSHGEEHHDEHHEIDWKGDMMDQKNDLLDKHFKIHKEDQDEYHKMYHHHVHNMPWYGKHYRKKNHRPYYPRFRLHKPWHIRSRKKSKRFHKHLPKYFVPWHAGYVGYNYGHVQNNHSYDKKQKNSKSKVWTPLPHVYQGYYGYGTYKPWKKREKHRNYRYKPKNRERTKFRARKVHKTYKKHRDDHRHTGDYHSPSDEHKEW